MSEVAYYQQASLWSRGPDDYQVQVCADVLQMLPTDVRSVLDVGCGDGFVTDALPGTLDVVGLDISRAAVAHVSRPTQIGSIESLPFEDDAFDLVMANDVIEHLEDSALARAKRELVRVAKRYILLTVPFAERMDEAIARCASCGTTFHVNHHARRFEERELLGLFGEPDAPYEPIELRYSGSMLRQPPDPLAAALLRCGMHRTWPHAMCPKCGGSAEPNSTEHPILDAVRARNWWRHGPGSHRIMDRSELMVLFRRKGVKPAPPSHIARTPVARESRSGELLSIDFKNRLQHVIEWRPGARLALFSVRGGLEMTDEGPVIGTNATEAMWLEAAFPIGATTGDWIDVEVSGENPMMRVIGWDPLHGREIPLSGGPLAAEDNGVAVWRFHIDHNNTWTPSRFGTLLHLYLDSEFQLHRLQWHAPDRSSDAQMLDVPAGHSVVELPPLQVGANTTRRTWGCFVTEAGRLPAPADEMRPADLAVAQVGWREVLDAATEAHSQQRTLVDRALEDVRQRAEALTINWLRRDLHAQDTRGGVTESSETSEHPPEASGERPVQPVRRPRHLRVERVLVLANWFPSDAQPGLGSFVMEQVQALRDSCGLDVRVLCGRPYWISTLRPWVVARGLADWRATLRNLSWAKRDGVPVLEFPYLVGLPFPLYSHSWTYRTSALRALPILRRSFRFDVMHAHTAFLDGNAAAVLAKRLDVPWILTEHTGPFDQFVARRWIRRRTMLAFREAHRTFAVSSSHATQIARHLLPGSQPVQVLHNGIDVLRFQASHGWQPSPDAPRFVAIGVFEDVKNPDLLLDAFARVQTKRPNARLTLVGGGPLEEHVRSRVQALGLRDAVEFTGRLTRDAVALGLSQSWDILVIASRAETFGMSAIEAMASGKPVVATRCGGPEDTVDEPWLGTLCNNNDPAALAHAMSDVARRLLDFDTCRIAAEAARRFDLAALAHDLHEQYTEVVLEHTQRTYRDNA